MSSGAYVEVFGVDLLVFGQVEVLLRNHHTLTEDVLMDLLAIRLGNQPGDLNQYCISVSTVSVLLTSWRLV